MIDKQFGNIIIECDSCPEVLLTNEPEFEQARAVMQREGWKVGKIGKDWLHGCPNCGVPRP